MTYKGFFCVYLADADRIQTMGDQESKKSEVAQSEEELLKFWAERDIFWKSLAARKEGPRYTFYDGPPFATGTPHYGHLLASAIKDAVPRYQTMRGKYVERRWGWDCHGLPIENIVEKDLKISGKKQIEELGVAKFNDYARSKVLEYVGEWKKTILRLARWVDFDGSYKTMDNTYIESVWWAVAELHKKGLVYEGTRVLPYCPRCETPIAQSEIAMDNSYKDITDLSVYVKFELKDEPGTFLVAWTTTPWTLPGNTALGVKPQIDYVKIRVFARTENGQDIYEQLIIAKSLYKKAKSSHSGPLASIFYPRQSQEFQGAEDPVRVVKELKGSDLVGQYYKPVFEYFLDKNLPNKDRAWKVYAADYVSDEEGSGIVHLAPAFGAEDMELAQREDIPILWHVNAVGRFSDEVTDLAGQLVKPKEDHQRGDVEIIKLLAARNLLFKKEKIVHSYPHCFRCETPLYYYAIPAWFIKIQEIKPRLLELNKNINWIPKHLQEGRFGKSLAGAPDWNISRNRYWASPLPIWKCSACQAIRVIGSIEELGDQLASRNTFYFVRYSDSTKNTPDINDTSPKGYPLTEAGRRQAEETGEYLRTKGVTKIVASPIERTEATAAIIAQAVGVPVTTDERLLELRTGLFEGKMRGAYRDFFHDEAEMWRHRPPGGENREDVFRRMREALIDLNTHNEGEVIVIVSHGDPLWFTKAWLESRSLPEGLAETAYPERGQAFTLPVKEIDLHRPWIDSVTLPCSCSGTMMRIPEVFDCWFESGSMPYAATHYPFENIDWLKDNFPGDFVAEYIAQTRTWFYYMHALSGLLFDSIPFKNVVTTGNILAEDGQKMSKSKKNYPDPWLLINRYGADALRFYLLGSSVMRSEDINFSEKSVDEVFKKVILRLQNVLAFYELYPDTDEGIAANLSDHVLDRWVVARLAEVTHRVTLAMEAYEIDGALRALELYIDDLSVWYVRRSRTRLRDQETSAAAARTLRLVLRNGAKLLAPFTPFLAERVYQVVKESTEPESVHLSDWPVEKPLDSDQQKLLSEMATVRKLVELGHAARSAAGIKVRQPLARATATGIEISNPALTQIFLDELNVREFSWQAKGELGVQLDTTITKELKQEGTERELVRTVQALRKKHGLDVTAHVIMLWQTDEADFRSFFEGSKYLKRLETTTFECKPDLRDGKVEIDGRTFYLALKDHDLQTFSRTPGVKTPGNPWGFPESA
jgi:isoleucyl-tRNA synthetase